MKLSPRNTLLVTVLGVALVVVALAAVLVIPMFGKISALDSEMAAAEQESESARFLLEQRREVRDRAAVTDAKLMQLSTSFPEDPELTSVIIEIQDLAYAVPVALRAVEPLPVIVADEGNYLTIPVTIEFLGDWSNCIEYLEEINKLTRQLRIVDFTAEPFDAAGITDTDVRFAPYPVRIRAQLEAYSVLNTPAPAEVPAEPAPAP